MTRLPVRELALVLACLLAVLGLVGTFLWQDRSSLERGNRLYHDGQVQRAEQLYRASTESPVAPPTALYNLGTALLTLGTPETEHYLRLATEAGDSAAAQRGHYNLGLGFLTQFNEAAPDSWIPLLTAAVGSNRAALRLDPGDENARWNLALAQRMLDDLTRVIEPDEASSGEEETLPEAQDGVVIPQPGENEEQPPPTEGGRETLAGVDPGPLTEAEALRLVEVINDDPEQLLWGILWSHRPEVAWWAESYPGGDW